MRWPWQKHEETEQERWLRWIVRFRETRLKGQSRDALNPWLVPPSKVGDEAANERYKAFLDQFDWFTGERRKPE